MEEELFISGRDIHNIDPHLAVWHWPISVDLFFGGLVAGLLFFASLFYLLGKEKEYPAVVRIAPIIAPIGISIALLCLFYDLTHKLYFWRLYLTFKIESPMSFGSWVLLFIAPLSFLWVFSYIESFFPRLNLRFSWLISLKNFTVKYRRIMAILLIPLSLSLGIYTGILLSAFNARPLWNSSILGPLFLTSGLTTACATMLYFVQKIEEKNLVSKMTLFMLVIQLFLMTHMILGFYAGSAVQLEAIQLLIGGEFTLLFVGVVIILGIVLPLIIQILEFLGFHIPHFIPATLIVVGGLIFRFVVVDAGQITRYLY